jgi:hypothetical protein
MMGRLPFFGASNFSGLFRDQTLGRRSRARRFRRNRKCQPAVPALRTIGRIEFAISSEAQKALHAADRKQISNLRADTQKNISNLQFAPTFNIGLPDRWFLTLFPSADIRINYGDPITGQTGRLFGRDGWDSAGDLGK